MIAFALRASAACAHGVVGDYVFLEPLITEDPTPANELDILERPWVKSSDGNDYSIGFSGEKVLWIDNNDMPIVSPRLTSNGTTISKRNTYEYSL